MPPCTVVFSHGKESGPWGAKITAMAEVVRALALSVESVDYRGIDDPALRVRTLLVRAGQIPGAKVLVGSSMGGHVSAAAAASIAPLGLFLLAPALYMQGYEAHTPRGIVCPTVIVHGWRDDIVPAENSIRWAREHRATLHLVDAEHRLEDQLDIICLLLKAFLLRQCATAA